MKQETILKMTDMWIVEYSSDQGCFHVQRLSETLRSNMSMVLRRTSNDFLPIALAESREEANAFAYRFNEMMATETVEPEYTGRSMKKRTVWKAFFNLAKGGFQ